jgi:error-prone DNA polymerase
VLALDYERVRLSLHDHPLRHLRDSLQRRAVLTTEELARCPAGRKVSVAGLVTARQRPGTASGVVFVTLEDEWGVANLIFYSRIFEAYRSVAQHSPLLLVSGKVERHDPAPGSVDAASPHQAHGVAAIVHLLVESAERLEVPGPRLKHTSRDFR